MNFKRVASGVCALALVCGVAAAPAQSVVPAIKTAIVASAADYEVYGDLHYKSDGTQIYITGYESGDSTTITIPSKIKGLPVVTIESYALSHSRFKKVTIQPGVKLIKKGAFDSSAISSIELPNTLTTIESSSFTFCDSLEAIVIPDSVTSLGYLSFDYCKNLKSVKLSQNLKTLEYGMFENCYNLVDVKLPSKLRYIESFAFESCKQLESITLPNQLEEIQSKAFICQNLKRVDIPKSVTKIGERAFGYYKYSFDEESDKVNGFTIGCYKGTAAEEYANKNGFKKIYLNKSISSAAVKTTGNVFAYNGGDIKPDVSVTLNGNKLIKGVDYTVSYSNNKNCGKATVTVTGINEYMGTANTTFIIKPKKMTAKKLVSPKKKTVKLTWVKAGGNVDGYQILLGTNKKFTAGKKSVIIKRPAAAAKTIKKLKSKKTYYAKIRAFKKVDGKNYFGAWSKLKKVKVK